jgi:hypothetical protein
VPFFQNITTLLKELLIDGSNVKKSVPKQHLSMKEISDKKICILKCWYWKRSSYLSLKSQDMIYIIL